MYGGENKQPLGYTLIEIMIFLAISGFMFIVAATFISGKQATAEFQQGMNDINSQVQDTINNVSDGYYPTSNQLDCSSSTSTGKLDLTAGTNTQGSNGGINLLSAGGGNGCVFLGQVIQFGVNGDPTKYNIYTIAGSQYQDGGAGPNLPSSLADAEPTAVVPTSSPSLNPPPDLTTQNTFEWGLKVTKMTDPSITGNLVAVGFFGNFGNINVTAGQSGSQTTNVVLFTDAGSQVGQDNETSMAGILSNAANYTHIPSNPDTTICFDGGAGHYGILTIGGTGQRLTTTIQIGQSKTGGC